MVGLAEVVFLDTTDAEQRETSYEYDALNRGVTTTNALDGQTVVFYDEVGNRRDTIDANDVTTHYEYDTLYRLLTTTLNYIPGGPNNSETNLETGVTYDALGNRLTVEDARVWSLATSTTASTG